MTPELAAALAALVSALAAVLRQLVNERRAREHEARMRGLVHDVQAKVGADRRARDHDPPE